MTDVARAPGGSLLYNRRNLADKMINVTAGGYIDIHIPQSLVGGEEKRIRFKGTLDIRDQLRDLVYQLLTTVAYDVQDRFSLTRRHEGLGCGNAFLADDVIGCELANAIRSSSKTTLPTHGSKSR